MRYHNITHDDMLNGDGLRTVLWVSGCTHRCEDCQNPVTWDINGGLPFDKAAEEELFRDLSKDYISGITFSGGDPLHPQNREEIARLAETVKQKFPEKSVWLYTGYLWDDIKDLEAVRYVDVLVDGPYVKQLRDPQLHWKGSSNQRVIDVQASLSNNNVTLHKDN
ncbi:MAG: anaerobic ribonucleoside-triphosphate reductase activating protein [Firmicutes bacterium]|nr:anaerobic ribonucleoside-triphosphate reductase activating protein [Bacillota bacterium]